MGGSRGHTWQAVLQDFLLCLGCCIRRTRTREDNKRKKRKERMDPVSLSLPPYPESIRCLVAVSSYRKLGTKVFSVTPAATSLVHQDSLANPCKRLLPCRRPPQYLTELQRRFPSPAAATERRALAWARLLPSEHWYLSPALPAPPDSASHASSRRV